MPGPGTRIDRFVIERLLGRGGMAEVYAARDTHLRRLVALKLLRSDRDDAAATARLLREARAAASFQHPGAVVVYDVFENDGAAYMAMELVSGRTLRSYIGDASIPIEKRLRWLVDVARALGAAHRAGLVHRDVKPHNVMVSDDGAIKVLDFGIARSHHRSPIVGEDTAQTLGTLTEVGAVIGTPLYASPEQLSAAPVDERSDQFAWGVMGYELCCGLLPWRRRDTLTMLAQLVSGDIPTMLQRIVDAAAAHQEAAAQGLTTRSTPPPPNPALYTEIPEEIEPVLRRAMRREPDERFATIDDAADMLEEHAEAPLSMRYIPRSALPPVDGSVESLSRTGLTPSAARDDGAHHSPSVLTSPRRAAPAATTARNLRELGALAAAGLSMTQVPPVVPSAKSLPPSLPPSDGTPRSPGQPEAPPSAAEPLSGTPSMPISAPSTTTSGRIATGGTTADASPEGPETSEADEEAPRVWRKTTAAIAAVAFLAAVAVGVATSWNDRRGSGQGTPAPSASAAPTVARVPCAPAEVRGAPAVPNAPALFGQAACVRLAIALGVPWDPAPGPGSTPLAVTVEGGAEARVTVSLAGQTASADALKALVALDSATRALAGKLAAPAVSAERQRELGAESEAAARRVEAILRGRAARLTQDPAADLSEAIGLAPRSPWPRLVALPDAAGPQAQRLRDEVLAVTGALPDPLAEAARGTLWLRAPKTDTERDDAIPALRRAYAARPDDGVVTAALAEALLGAGLHEEAAAVGLRIADRAPDQSLGTLAALVQGGPQDPTWIDLRGRLLDRLEVLLPESRGWDTRALHEALAGHVAAARASLSLGDTLGVPSSTGRAWARDLSRAAVEIADDRPAEARALVQPFLGSPSPAEAALATRLLVQTHLLEGHIAEAETALSRDIARLDALGDPLRAAERWITLLGIHRKLGAAPPEIVDVTKLEATLAALEATHSPLAPALRAEIFLVQLARKEKAPADAAEVQRAIEAYAHKVARGDRMLRDELAAAALPVAFAGSGLDGVRTTWGSLGRARSSAKLPYLLLHGMASEKAGATEDAERAYRLVASAPLSADGLDHLAARFRLAHALEKLGRKEEATKWRESTGRILQNAARDVVQALDRAP